MAYTQYYYQPADRALSATEIRRRTGINPKTYGASGLAALRIYPITKVENPYDTGLYSVALTHTINGANADETWTPTARPLTDAKVAGKRKVKKAFGTHCSAIFDDDINSSGLIAIASVASAARCGDCSDPFVQAGIATGILQDTMDLINLATTVDEINDIVNPKITCVTGTLSLSRSSSSAKKAVWKVAPTGAKAKEITIVYPNETVSYNAETSEYPAVSDAWSNSPYTFEVKFGSHVIGSFKASTSSTDFVIDWKCPNPICLELDFSANVV